MHDRFPGLFRTILALVACWLVASLVLPGGVVADDPEEACAGDGWQDLVMEDGTAFESEDDCTAYLAEDEGGAEQEPLATPAPLHATGPLDRPTVALTAEGVNCQLMMIFEGFTPWAYTIQVLANDGFEDSFELGIETNGQVAYYDGFGGSSGFLPAWTLVEVRENGTLIAASNGVGCL